MGHGKFLVRRQGQSLHGADNDIAPISARLPLGRTGHEEPAGPFYRHCVAFCKNFISAARSSGELIVCSGILVPGVKVAGPTSNNLATVSGVQTMSSFFSAGEKL